MKDEQAPPSFPWVIFIPMIVGLLGVVVSIFAWLFGEGPLSTPWFLATYNMSVALACVTWYLLSRKMPWFMLFLVGALDLVVTSRYIVNSN